MAKTGMHSCPMCRRTYSRKEHLNRHLITHTKTRPFICSHCQLTFNRKDVHTRHLAVCKANYDSARHSQEKEEISEVLQQNMKNNVPRRGSSERCEPHQLCMVAASESHFLRFEQEILAECTQNAIPNSLDLFFRIATTQGLAESFDPDLSSRIYSSPDPIHTLDNYTKAGARNSALGSSGLMRDIATPFRQTGSTQNGLKNEDNNLVYDEISESPPWNDYGSAMDFLELPHLSPFDDNSYLDPRSSVRVLPEIDPLSAISREIVGRLRDFVSHKPRNSYINLQWSSEVEKECLEFFSPDNLRRFMDLYWVTWYIHWPAIHKSTFQISKTPCTLVAAMVLIGASYSAISQDRACARTYCDAVEEIVFGDRYFGDSALYSVLNAACLERRLRSLQAAHAMCLYQVWEGLDTGKQRARRHRFGQVVAMARELGFAHASHGDLESLTESNFNWKEFILKEELIRTMNYVLVLDCGFIVMNNMPPRVFVSEMQSDLACPEACFQATSAFECFGYLKVWLSHPLARAGRISVLDAVEQLSRKDMSWKNLQAFTHLGYLNLGFLAMAMHPTIFQIRSSICWQSQTISMLRDWLRNWSIIWTLRGRYRMAEAFGTPLPPQGVPEKLEDRWRTAGFMKDATQFWLLAKILLDNLEHNRHKAHVSPFVRKTDDYDQTTMKYLKGLLEGHRRLQE